MAGRGVAGNGAPHHVEVEDALRRAGPEARYAHRQGARQRALQLPGCRGAGGAAGGDDDSDVGRQVREEAGEVGAGRGRQRVPVVEHHHRPLPAQPPHQRLHPLALLAAAGHAQGELGPGELRQRVHPPHLP